MVYIGKTYSLWYKIIKQLEEITEDFEHKKKNVSYINSNLLILYWR